MRELVPGALVARRLARIGQSPHRGVFVRDAILDDLPLLGLLGAMLNDLVPCLAVVLALAIGLLGILVLDLFLLLIFHSVSDHQRSYVTAHCLMPPDDGGIIALGAHTLRT